MANDPIEETAYKEMTRAGNIRKRGFLWQVNNAVEGMVRSGYSIEESRVAIWKRHPPAEKNILRIEWNLDVPIQPLTEWQMKYFSDEFKKKMGL